MNTPNRPFAYLCLALSMSLVGSYVALSKPLAAVLPVFLLAWMRFGIGGLAMLHWLKKPADEPPLTPQTRRLLFLESFLGNFLFTICMIYGVSLTDAVSAGVTMAAIPAAVALMGWAFLRERVAPRTWLAVVCAVAGIALFSLSKPEHSAHVGQAVAAKNPQNLAWLGQLLLVGAVVCEAAYTVIGKKLTGSLGPKRITALINLWGFVLSTPFGLYLALGFDFGAVGWGTWALLRAVAPRESRSLLATASWARHRRCATYSWATSAATTTRASCQPAPAASCWARAAAAHWTLRRGRRSTCAPARVARRAA